MNFFSKNFIILLILFFVSSEEVFCKGIKSISNDTVTFLKIDNVNKQYIDSLEKYPLLKELYIYDVKHIPSNIKHLKNLRVLYIVSKKIIFNKNFLFPENLEELVAVFNKPIKILPEFMGNKIKIISLVIKNESVFNVNSIKLSNLETLNLYIKNNTGIIPNYVYSLTQLKHLIINGNNMMILSDELLMMKRLILLKIKCDLKENDDILSKLTTLQTLGIYTITEDDISLIRNYINIEFLLLRDMKKELKFEVSKKYPTLKIGQW